MLLIPLLDAWATKIVARLAVYEARTMMMNRPYASWEKRAGRVDAVFWGPPLKMPNHATYKALKYRGKAYGFS